MPVIALSVDSLAAHNSSTNILDETNRQLWPKVKSGEYPTKRMKASDINLKDLTPNAAAPLRVVQLLYH